MRVEDGEDRRTEATSISWKLFAEEEDMAAPRDGALFWALGWGAEMAGPHLIAARQSQ